MTVGLGTSVAVRLLVGEPAKQAQAARRVLEEEARESVTISDLVVGETYFALRYHYAVPHAKAVAALRALLSDRRIRATGVARQVLDDIPDRDTGAGLMDRLIHADYARDSSVMLTFDKLAARLPSARLLTD
jgi:predicted nucleic-acid-binding protein